MRTIGRISIAFSLILCSILANAQGGAGGYGQGAGGAPGGAFGGRSGGVGGGGAGSGLSREETDKLAKPDEDDDAPWESRTAILTPGDRVEFRMPMKKGVTLLAGVTSYAFDPALSVEDGKGTVLLKNDDREEGDQSPFIIYRAPTDGEYLLKVLSYRSVSGGKFNVKMRVFHAVDVGLGPKIVEGLSQRTRNGNPRIAFKLTCEKGHIYDLGSVMAHQGMASTQARLMRVIGPTGVESRDFSPIPTADGSPVISVLTPGDFYLEYYSYQANTFRTDFKDVQVVQANAATTVKLDLAPAELKVVEFPVTAGQIIRTTLMGGPITMALSAPGAEGINDRYGDEAWGNNKFWTWFKMNRDSDNDIVRIFHGTGTARVALRSIAPGPSNVMFTNRESLPEWKPGEADKGSLDIGGVRLYLIKSSKSELMRVDARANHFQPQLDIFRMNGDLANTLCDRKAHKASDDLYFPDEGTFIVRLSCDGYGGSGDYVMARDVLTPQAYAMGKTQMLKLDGQNFGLYAVNLEAGKRYELMTDQPDKSIRADLLDADGQFLVSQGLTFDKVEVQYFTPKRSGVHRLWLRGGAGERQFKFQLHTAPTIGG